VYTETDSRYEGFLCEYGRDTKKTLEQWVNVIMVVLLVTFVLLLFFMICILVMMCIIYWRIFALLQLIFCQTEDQG
jgi:hypothetical protein